MVWPLYVKGRIAGDDEKPADAGECRDDLLDHPVSEIFLIRIAAHIGERQHRDRWLVKGAAVKTEKMWPSLPRHREPDTRLLAARYS
jgi:hypothetical protein